MDDSANDQFEIEVTDLNTGATARHPLAQSVPDGPDGDEPERSDDDTLDTHEMPPSLQPPSPARRRQRLRAAIVSGVVLLAVVVVALANPAARTSLYTVFRFPTPLPSPTPQAGRNLVYLVRGAPWGRVTVDGKKSGTVNLSQTFSWVRLPSGHHTVIVTQEPFPPLHCTISYPAAKSDTCPLISPQNDMSGEYTSFQQTAPGARFIDLGAYFDHLPPDVQDRLVEMVSAELKPPGTPVTLHPGDHYLRDDGSVAVAHTTLQGLFLPTILTPVSVGSDSTSCVSFCDVSGAGMGGGGVWSIRVTELGSWRITTPGGQVLAQHAPMFPADRMYTGLSSSTTVQIDFLWTGRWQMSVQNGFGGASIPACQTAQDMLDTNIAVNGLQFLGMNQVAGGTSEEGCLISFSLAGQDSNDPTYLYYHLGVFLAANDAAHRAFPGLPVASANEGAQARQMAGGNGVP